MAVIIVAIAACGLLLGGVVIFNRLIARRQMVNNGWADIDVQLKRRSDLVPQLVATVQAYAAHERQLFADIAAKRGAALAAGDDPAQRGAAETALAQPVARMLAVAEAYPELKANENFLELQKALADTEDQIEMARRFYNGAVRELNTLAESFPSNLVAALAGIARRAYFEIGAGEGATPRIEMGRS